MTDKKFNYKLDKDESDNDSAQSDSHKSPIHKISRNSSRRSRRATNKNSETSPIASSSTELSKHTSISDTPPNKNTKKTSKKSENKLQNQLRTTIQEVFNHNLKDHDLDYLKILFTSLSTLDETWDRIGFNSETKLKRFVNFYVKINETASSIIEGEEDLENDILDSIESKTKKIKKITLELGLKYDDSKVSKLKTILLKDDWLKKELNKLETERENRMTELEKLIGIEEKLCQRLKFKQTELNRTVPTQEDLSNLAKKVKELEALAEKRNQEMIKYCEEIKHLYAELDVSRTDSFVEVIIYDSDEELPLSEEDIIRAKELVDYLKEKDSLISNEIRTIRTKIKELWLKLNIENDLTLKNFILSSPAELNPSQLDAELKRLKKNKKQLYDALESEYEECVKIKMANMQKFIETVRVEIRRLCQLMFYGEKDMKKINQEILSSNDFTEDLLQIHENKLEDLKFKYEESVTLYEKTAKWMQVWAEFVQFEEITKDPSRLTQRGYSVLDESKKRTKFEKELPKLIAEITHLADEYANLNGGTSFTINDLYYSEYIERKKYDHEENKLNERKEKQIMKDQIKKNESKFGVSKIKTPLRAKRKAPANNVTSMQVHETVMQTPSRQSKMLKTDSSIICGTPGLSSTRSNAMVGANLKPKLNLHNKLKSRKSKTPRKKSLRGFKKPTTEQDDTVSENTTIKSYASSNKSNITGSTNLSNMTTSSSRYNFSSNLTASKPKLPPLSSSSKFSAASTRINNLHEVMTSTASNSMIGEENFDDIENIDQSVINTNTRPLTVREKLIAAATAKINKGSSSLSSQAAGAQFNFKMPSTGLKYNEFSKDLSKSGKIHLAETSNYLESKSSRSRLGNK